MSSKLTSGSVSRTPYSRSTARRPASSWYRGAGTAPSVRWSTWRILGPSVVHRHAPILRPGGRSERLAQLLVELVTRRGVHDLFQEQGPHGDEEGGGFCLRVAGAGQAVEGKAVEEGEEGFGRRLRLPGTEGGQHPGDQPLEGGQRFGGCRLERRVAARLQIHLVLGHESRRRRGDQNGGHPLGKLGDAGAGGVQR